MPRRGAKDSTNVQYEDQDEDEDEVEEWERLAEEAQLEASKSGGSPVKPMLSATDPNIGTSNEDYSDMDVDGEEVEEMKEEPQAKAAKKKTSEKTKGKPKTATKTVAKAGKNKTLAGQASITSFLGVGTSKENNKVGEADAKAKSKSKVPASKKVAISKSGTKNDTLLR